MVRWNNAGFLVPDIVGKPQSRSGLGRRADRGHPARQSDAVLPGYHADGVLAGASPMPATSGARPSVAGLELNLPMGQRRYLCGSEPILRRRPASSCYQQLRDRGSTTWLGAWSTTAAGSGSAGSMTPSVANTAATGATGLQLSTAWNVVAAIQHYWVPDVRTSLYGAYVQLQGEQFGGRYAGLCAAPRQPDSRDSSAATCRLRRLGGLADRLAHDLESGAQSRYRRGRALHRSRANRRSAALALLSRQSGAASQHVHGRIDPRVVRHRARCSTTSIHDRGDTRS